MLVCTHLFWCSRGHSCHSAVAIRFALEYGVLRLSIGEVLRRVLATQPNTDLVQQISQHLRSGCTVPDELAVQALDVVLMDMECQVRGFVRFFRSFFECMVYGHNTNLMSSLLVCCRYILDGFPVTKRQVDLMTERSIIPVKLLELRVDDDEVFKRATLDRRLPSR